LLEVMGAMGIAGSRRLRGETAAHCSSKT
jgi:hypothetical protein